MFQVSIPEKELFHILLIFPMLISFVVTKEMRVKLVSFTGTEL